MAKRITTEIDPLKNTPAGKPRARSLGVPFHGTPGKNNAITDVPGVEIGYQTLIHGQGKLEIGHGPVRSGVTAILPRGKQGVGIPVAAGWHSLNGNGELTGSTWIEEAGALTTPILLTDTHAVGPCHEGAITWMTKEYEDLRSAWLLPVVGETYSGYLSDINGGHIRPEHAIEALDTARGGPIEEGSVGGGTGMCSYGFKGGNGTASRVVNFSSDSYQVGAFVQANFGSRHELTIAGRKLGDELAVANPMEEGNQPLPPGAGSVIVIVATDAPLLPGQAKAMARRASLGLARTGTSGSHYSGDIFLAFSTANPGSLTSKKSSVPVYESLSFIPWGAIDPFYEAVVDAVEEAVVNALVANESMTGRDNNIVPSIPHDQLHVVFSENGASLSSTP